MVFYNIIIHSILGTVACIIVMSRVYLTQRELSMCHTLKVSIQTFAAPTRHFGSGKGLPSGHAVVQESSRHHT